MWYSALNIHRKLILHFGSHLLGGNMAFISETGTATLSNHLLHIPVPHRFTTEKLETCDYKLHF